MGPLSLRHWPLEVSEAPGQWRLYPIGDRATRREKWNLSLNSSVTRTPQSVTYVLNLKCYLCFDWAWATQKSVLSPQS